MKKKILIAAAASIVLLGCGSNAEKIIKKYEAYGIADANMNKAGFSIANLKENENQYSVTVNYSNSLLKYVEEYVQISGSRLVAADAENSSKILPAKTTFLVDSLNRDENGLPAYHTVLSINKKDIQSGFVIIGFKGIGKDESEELETPPLFYILELDGKSVKVINEKPFSSSKIFATDYQATHFSADAVKLQQIIGSWGRTGGSFKTDPNDVETFSPDLSFRVDSSFQKKPSLIFGEKGKFTSDIDYSKGDGVVDLFKYAKSLRIGKDTAWECSHFIAGQAAQGKNSFIFFFYAPPLGDD
jgi:hypothetical protein